MDWSTPFGAERKSQTVSGLSSISASNPLVADLLHRVGFIEKAGTGIRRMREEAKKYGSPEPKFDTAGFFTATFYPSPEVRRQALVATGEAANHVGTKLALSRHQVEILTKCVEDQPLVALLAVAERSDRTKFRNQVLGPLLAQGLIEMTIPDKPRSSKQRYRTTALGLKVLSRKKRKG